MPFLPFTVPHWRQPRARLFVRDEFKPIGGIQPGGFGFEDTFPSAYTIGSGITLVEGRPGEPRALDFTIANTGLTKTVSYAAHPFSFVGLARTTNAGTTQCLGSIATAADKTVRVFADGTAGAVFAQHIGATTNARADSAQVFSVGDVFAFVAVFRSPTDVRIYGKGSNRSGVALSPVVSAVRIGASNVGALGTLTKFSIGVYDGSVKNQQFVGQIFMAEWLRVEIDPSTAFQLLNNPWAIYEPDLMMLPFDVPAAATSRSRRYYDMLAA